jgi:acetyl esterase/lipase
MSHSRIPLRMIDSLIVRPVILLTCTTLGQMPAATSTRMSGADVGRVARALATAMATLISGCSGLLFTAANAPTYLTRVRVHTDLPYGTDVRQRLDVYALPGADRPVVVFWYGGSWTSGKKSEYRFVGTALAERGFVAVLPDYRLYPQVRFPAFIEDGARAVAWTERHAREFGGDPTRIVLMGHSAGAHLAAMLALDARYLAAAGADRSGIRALVGLSGPYALVPNDDTLRAIFGPPFTSADWQPVQHVDARAPPTLLLDGLEDQLVSVDQTRELRDALVKHGVAVDTALYPGVSHSDTIAAFSRWVRGRAPTLDRTTQFINRVARKPAPANP